MNNFDIAIQLINELKFTDKEAFKLYSNKHKIKPTTKVKIGNKTIKAGDIDNIDNIKIRKKNKIKKEKKIKTHDSKKEKSIELNNKKYNIPIKLKNNFKNIDTDLSALNIKNWKAKVILNNSGGDNIKKGQFDDVGMLMISNNKNSNTIIPICTADEHRNGYELLYHYRNKGLIDKNDKFTSINPLGMNYIYDPTEDDVIGYKNFRKMGGDNVFLKVTKQGKNHAEYVIDADTFIDINGDITKIKPYLKEKNKLAPVGLKIVDNLENLATLYKQYHQDKSGRPERYEKQIYIYANKLLKIFYREGFSLGFHLSNSQYKLKTAIENEDITEIENAIFSHNGIKNNLHNIFRQTNKDADAKKDAEVIFGLLDVAKEEFDRLSAI